MDSYNSSMNPIGYAGEYHDEESGMIYLRGRYYDPEICRFITEDPAKDGLNWYAYCGNNPVTFVDPTGFWGGELHYNMTQWIFAEFGFNSYHANVVATANKATDDNWDTSPFNPKSAGRHFDRDTNQNIDSRISYAESCYSDAVNTWNMADELYNNGDITEEQRHAMRVQSLESLGRGLHSLQDVDAHLDYNEGDVLYTPHHTGRLIDLNYNIAVFDDPGYDIYKNEEGVYYHVYSNSEYGSSRYANSVDKSRNYIYRFYVDTRQIG